MDENKKTIAAYDKIANSFFDVWDKATCMEGKLEEFISYLPQNGLVIDIGCGTGRDVKYLNLRGKNAIGIDLSIGMIKYAKNNNPDGNLCVMDFLKLGIKKNSITGIWACGSLLHIPKSDLVEALQKLYEILCNRGVLYLTMQFGDSEGFKGDGRYFAYYSEDEIKEALLLSKFKIFKIDGNVSTKGTFDANVKRKWMNFWASK